MAAPFCEAEDFDFAVEVAPFFAGVAAVDLAAGFFTDFGDAFLRVVMDSSQVDSVDEMLRIASLRHHFTREFGLAEASEKICEIHQ